MLLGEVRTWILVLSWAWSRAILDVTMPNFFSNMLKVSLNVFSFVLSPLSYAYLKFSCYCFLKYFEYCMNYICMDYISYLMYAPWKLFVVGRWRSLRDTGLWWGRRVHSGCWILIVPRPMMTCVRLDLVFVIFFE